MTDPMNWSPLGDYKEFRSWSGRPRSWGPTDAGWRAWFGGKVIDGLCEVLDEHLAANRSGAPAAIGCVAYLTSRAVVDRLLKMAGLCVVIDKGAVLPPRQLVESDLGFPNTAIRALAEKTPAVGGKGMIVGPYTPR